MSPARWLAVSASSAGLAFIGALQGVRAGPASEPQNYPGCPSPRPAFVHSYYVDPAQTRGDGSRNAPFGRLSDALAVAKEGDAIVLEGGDYGDVRVSGAHGDFVTVVAAPGQQARLSSLTVGNNQRSSYWRFSGLTIRGYSHGLYQNGWQTHTPLVTLRNSDNVVLDGDVISSDAGDYVWRAELQGRDDALSLASGISATNVSCVALLHNRIFDVFNGIAAGGDQTKDNGKRILIAGNRIDNFAGDGIDHYASQIDIVDNVITNAHDICNSVCIHNDGIQGWNYNNLPGLLNHDVVIARNTIIQSTGPSLALPAPLQGITIFDGNWETVQIQNNVVVSPTYHGISIYGVHEAVVANNTVVSPVSRFPAWISVQDKKGGPETSSFDVVVRNNIASSYMSGARGRPLPGVRMDHNLTLSSPARTFVVFDPGGARYDLHLSPRSPARGAGSLDEAPIRDLDGQPRGKKEDAGAYAYVGPGA